MRRVTYDEYVLAAALAFARRHRPIWSWRHWRRICRCGAELPAAAVTASRSTVVTGPVRTVRDDEAPSDQAHLGVR